MKLVMLFLSLSLCMVSPVHAADCKDAVALSLGQPAPCDGVLLPDDDVLELLRLQDLEPQYRDTIADLSDQLELCLTTPDHVVAPAIPWWKSPVFWGVFCGGLGVLLGGGAAVWIGLAVR